ELIPQILEVLDLADAFCRAQQFLALSRTPYLSAYSHWFLEEFSRQATGEPALRWEDSDAAREVS
ncbi:MAG: ATP-binding protein, partial [Nocardioides sp.]